MSKNITEYVTGKGEILFMTVARAFENKKTGKTEFSVKIKLDENDEAVKLLSDIASYKIDTKTNRALAGTGKTVVNFTTAFNPAVVSADNTELKGQEIPYFDGRVDKGTAIVSFKVIDYGDNKIVRLSGVKLIDLELTPKEDGGDSMEVTLDMLKGI